MEQTREFKVTIEIYRDTNKGTYSAREEFESVEAAREWLDDYVDDNVSLRMQ